MKRRRTRKTKKRKYSTCVMPGWWSTGISVVVDLKVGPRVQFSSSSFQPNFSKFDLLWYGMLSIVQHFILLTTIDMVLIIIMYLDLYTYQPHHFFYICVSKFFRKTEEKEAAKNYIEQSKSYEQQNDKKCTKRIILQERTTPSWKKKRKIGRAHV